MRTWKSVSVGSLAGSVLAIALGTIWSCNSALYYSVEMDAGTEDGSVWVPPGPPDLRRYDPDAFWENDPPLMSCVPDGGTLPPPKPPGGTPDCPDDKNREGCPCTTLGEKRACWPGLRANRGLGICRDGQTTCVRLGELSQAWGACEGYVTPVPGATAGADACKCFSAGRWALDNLVPCFYTYNGEDIGAASSVNEGGMPKCVSMSKPLQKPTSPWSPNTLTVDCVGHWKLCYTLKAGDAANPQPTDCVVSTVCTEGDYGEANKVQSLPQLPAWATTTAAQIACAKQFKMSGGYGEMSVDGKTVTCDQVQSVFNRVKYCPLSCNTDPTQPECKNCGSGGSGGF
ncbi:MAG: hypothetical protein JNM83_10535 [Myxococcales bacterium]|nr:hypothetical protein [Myxococcales bacterium]